MEKQFKCARCGTQYDYIRTEGCVVCPGAKSIVKNSNYTNYPIPSKK